MSDADVLLYGGAAGGGKTDLAIGLALTAHRRSLIVRREGLQLLPVKDRITEIVGSRDGLNAQNGVWVLPSHLTPGYEVQVQFGGVPNPGDENKFQGNPRDLLVLDEAANLLESQARFLMGWVRSTIPGQRCRTLMCSNPPTSAEGEWLLDFFAPWLRDTHPNPAAPGELRWYATIDGRDIEVEDSRPFIMLGDERVYDFDAQEPGQLADVITPLSRTFIPSRVVDNPFLLHTGYMRTLQGLPEPLRSQMLYGDFLAGTEDDAWQTIPSDWVQAAMDRWEKKPDPGVQDSIGVDVARGGPDCAVISPRYGSWYAELTVLPGKSVASGSALGVEVLRVRRNLSPVHVDAIGVGASVYDYLKDQGAQTVAVTGSEESNYRDRTNSFTFRNKRSELYWKFRESLDPYQNSTVSLPPDPALKSDLCAPRFKILEGNVIAVEPKPDLIKRLGRSPDRGDAVIYASVVTPKHDAPGRRLDYSRLNRAAAGSPVRRRMR